ncbi:MAG: T9SS type A sorting domain-containing protein, partial [Tannerella sp.]|nr:T9SS type A sorting domain-containing protein [Tannerella sp.]
YNDAFGFFVSGPGLTDEWGNTGDTINIARYPDGTPIAVNASNWGYRAGDGFSAYDPMGATPVGLPPTYAGTPGIPGNSLNAIRPEYHVPVYNDVNKWLMEYHGHSIVLTARARVIPGEWYHLKLAIGNTSDTSLGSGVFLQAGSLDLGAPESEVSRPYVKSEYDSIYGYSSLYADCINTLLLTFNKGTAGNIKVWSQGSGANYVYDADGGAFFKDTVTYPISAADTAVAVRFKVAENVPDGSSLFFFSQLSNSLKKDTSEVFTLYAKSVFDLQRFIPTSVYVSGTLDIVTAKGSPYIQRSLDGGRTWEFARDTLTGKDRPFTPLQIEQLTYLKEVYILYREPNTCCPFDSILVAVPKIPPPLIQRKVIIPEIPGAATSPAAGVHYVRSSSDFVFTIIPYPENSNWELCIRAFRNASIDESDDGLTVTHNPDGSYTVRVLRVQEEIHFAVTFTAPLVSNAPVDRTGSWTDGHLLYIRASRDGEARIYSISGALIQTVAVEAGKTASVRLPKGFYLVTADGQTYKIIIR